MKKTKVYDVLNGARFVGGRVTVRLKTDKGKRHGYVVGISEGFALLHEIHTDTMTLNGYLAFPLAEVKTAKVADGPDDFLHRAMERKGLFPAPQPDILLEDWAGILSSANAQYPLVTLFCERRWPGTCYIGRAARITERAVTLDEISPQAKWNLRDVYPFADITLAQFGDGYAESLWAIGGKDAPAKPRRKNK